jgi:hypothetical protein
MRTHRKRCSDATPQLERFSPLSESRTRLRHVVLAGERRAGHTSTLHGRNRSTVEATSRYHTSYLQSLTNERAWLRDVACLYTRYKIQSTHGYSRCTLATNGTPDFLCRLPKRGGSCTWRMSLVSEKVTCADADLVVVNKVEIPTGRP